MSKGTQEQKPSNQYTIFNFFSRPAYDFKLRAGQKQHGISKNTALSNLITRSIQNGIYELTLPEDIFDPTILGPILTHLEEPQILVDVESIVSQITRDGGRVTDFLLALQYLEIDSLLEPVKAFVKDAINNASSAEAIRNLFKIPDDLDEELRSICDQFWSQWKIKSAIDDLTVSTILEGKANVRLSFPRPPPEIYFLLSRPAFFVPDDSVHNCYTCKITFGGLTRRHHCRACGKIFCSKCTSNTLNLPNDYQVPGPPPNLMTSYLPGSSSNDVKVCDNCFKFLSENGRLSRCLRGLEILDMDINLLKRAGTVSQSWKNGCTFLLSLLREIHYRLPTHVFTPREKRALYVNRNLWVGHSRWLTQYLKTVDWSDKSQADEALSLISQPRQRSCTEMMCSRLCKPSFTMSDAVELLGPEVKDPRVRDRATHALKLSAKDNVEELLCFLPLLVHNLRFEPMTEESELVKFLLEKSVDSTVFRSDLYWELMREIKKKDRDKDNSWRVSLWLEQKLLLTIENKVGPDAANALVRGSQFVDILEMVPPHADVEVVKLCLKELDDLLAKGSIYLPLDPKKKIVEFQLDRIEVKSSATRPAVLPCRCIDEVTNKECIFKILLKKEDVRKDQLVLAIITLMSLIIKREGLTDVPIITYKVLPTSSDGGQLEIVQNARTLGSVTDDIINWLCRHNDSIHAVWGSMGKSTAAYLVMTYLLGVGDRHTDNVMIHQDAILFHIDYGFILGESPKPFMPYMLFTGQLKTALGGSESQHYKHNFEDLCPKIYTILRRHVGMITNLLRLVPGFDAAHVERQVLETFLPGMSEEDAESVFRSRMLLSTDALPHLLSESIRSIQRSGTFESVWGYASSYWSSKP